MSIVNFDRDLDYLALNRTFLYLSNEHAWNNPYVMSDGLIPDKESTLNYFRDDGLTDDITVVGNCRSIGINIVGPDITGGSPYRIQGYISETFGLHNIYLMIGVGPATFDGNNPGPGDFIVGAMPILSGHKYIEFDKTIYLPTFESMYMGSVYNERPLSVFCMFRRASGAVVGTIIAARLSVQRLSVKPSEYKTANR